MSTTKRLIGTLEIAFTMMAAGTMTASADIGREDASSNAGNIGTIVAINPQPLPPRCLPPGCKGGGNGGAPKFRSMIRRV
jgi:hypothetical protein